MTDRETTDQTQLLFEYMTRVEELKAKVEQLEGLLKLHKHTDECLAYAALTGKAYCIAECRDARSQGE